MENSFDKDVMQIKSELKEVNDESKRVNSTSPEKNKKHSLLLRKIEHNETDDQIRLKCREMLTDALAESKENEAEYLDCAQIAYKCENFIFDEFRVADLRYKNRIKSIVLNLKDHKNPKLKESVRLGLITPERLASMPVEEMANDELKELRSKLTQESINDHQLGRVEGAQTSLLTCPNCKKHDVVYSEIQINSDEPHKTFSYCQDCGYRWQFDMNE